jgi:DNA-binding transcriptional ArsR family regulator
MENTLDMGLIKANAGRASEFLKALANPDRLLLLCQLSQGERCVSDLATQTGIKQPTLSQQLTVLRNEGLVATRREGKQIYYRIDNADALAVMQILYARFCGCDQEATHA